MHAVNISGKTFHRAMFPRSRFRSVFLPSHFVATFDFLLARWKNIRHLYNFPARNSARLAVSSIPLLQMCIGSYNFRIILVNDCCRRLPSVAHKTTNCIPLHLLYIFGVPFYNLIQIFTYIFLLVPLLWMVAFAILFCIVNISVLNWTHKIYMNYYNKKNYN